MPSHNKNYKPPSRDAQRKKRTFRRFRASKQNGNAFPRVAYRSDIPPRGGRESLIVIDASRESSKELLEAFRQRSFRIGAQQVTNGKGSLSFFFLRSRGKWAERPTNWIPPGSDIGAVGNVD